MFHLLLVSEGPWGASVVQHLTRQAPPDWEAGHARWDQAAGGPSPDLLVALCEGGDLAEALPELASSLRPMAVLAPVEDSAWFPQDAQKRLASELKNQLIPGCFPSPFCALTHCSCAPLATFARCFGRPRLQIDSRGRSIRGLTVLTDTPCGFASRTAPKLQGLKAEEAEDYAWDCQTRCPRCAYIGSDPAPYFPLAVRLALEPFETVVAPHRQALMDYARAWLGDDVAAQDTLQETLLRAYEFYHQFTPQTDLRAWLRRILENVIHYEHRRQSRQPSVLSLEQLLIDEDDSLAQDLSRWNQPEEALLAKILSSELEGALQSLSPKLREVLLLAAVEELPHQEIAARLGLRVETVDKRLSRARKKVKMALYKKSKPGR